MSKTLTADHGLDIVDRLRRTTENEYFGGIDGVSSESDIAALQAHFEAGNPTDAFEVRVPIGPHTIPICGLCGNTGRIAPRELTIPNGTVFTPPEFFCLCPNGQRRKAHE